MKKIFVHLMILMAGVAHGQVVEDDTKVLGKPGGEALFSLQADEVVYSYEPEDGWYKIRKEVYVSPNEVVDDKYLNAGVTFYNKEKKEIGQTLAEIKLKEGERVKAFRGEDSYRAIIEGYVFKTKLADGSVPEERISELLASRNRNEQMAGFKELFDRYNFEERQFEDLTVHVMREQHKTLNEDKDFRVIVIFRNETSPYAIITNDHTVTAPKVKSTWEDYDFKIIYFYKPTSAQQDLVEDTILYTFMGL